jgi:hypothetical protein
MVPYEWVWMNHAFSSSLHLFHDELVEGVRIPFFYLLLFSNPVDLVRCGLSPSLVWCLLLFDSFPLIPVIAVTRGSKGSESRVLPLSFGSFVPKPLYACTCLGRSISLFLAVTTAPLRTLGMS